MKIPASSLLRLAPIGLVSWAMSFNSFAAPIYDQSFDYGNSVLDFGTDLSGDGWSDNTGVISYQPSGGLTYANLNGASGGALVYSEPTAGARNAEQTMSYDFAGDADGTVYYVFALGRIDTALTTGGITEMRFDGGSVVNTIGFGFDESTGLYASAWTTTPNALTSVSGGAYIVGDTYGFLARVTKGTGASPSNTQVEFWFNPDLANLGVADATITDSKFTRDGAGNALDGAFYGGNTGGGYTWDEVRFSTDYNDIYLVPEPSVCLLLVGGLTTLVVFRRRS